MAHDDGVVRRLRWPGILEAYRSALPIEDGAELVSLGEGGTLLRYAPHLSERVGARVFLKLEGLNPTGSFKDRGMALAVTNAKARGARAVICASTGNTSAAAAAYARAAGLASVVVVPSAGIARGKLAQALLYGARVVAIEGSFDDALVAVRQLAEADGVALVNSVNPDRLEGQKTVAFEIVDQLGDAPTVQVMPVGNAGNITASWRGYREAHAAGATTRLPRMVGVQAEGAAPIVRGEVVEHPETIASAIRIGRPASWQGALNATSDSGGTVLAVSDDAILEAYILLAREESVFCEPASAASVAGLLRLDLARSDTVVCILTGHGLKDPDTALRTVEGPVPSSAGLDAIARAAGLA
ncbi:threonine synthase [Acidimicrobium ferrooxidans DSM 10331]|uniref:Threonine synthase n=1 Tax=Acidimicrobium ferrooxidans (strain DSM 10331 / JCM 15462 / NBRC 103882 / ICP) TaxID=525909 RepID=C7M178_ACIFD|nr:threonine synthase [Acidimicrobium ferrooxidans]ACU54726.1 threonine synthase [Acidimicrobium ferrooxidans DSM 10331]